MTLETAAVEFLRASVAKAKAKRALHIHECEEKSPEERTSEGRLIYGPVPPCRYHIAPDDYCDPCKAREAQYAAYKATLKAYNQARRRALRALKRKG